MRKINFVNYCQKRFVKKSFVEDVSSFILSEMGEDKVEVSVVLCGNDRMREYNRMFRGKDYPTDVLSFPDGEKMGRYMYLGDVVISVDKVYEQSVEEGISPLEEFVRLLVHGILHLLGYDHEKSESDERRMMKLQETIVDRVLGKFLGSWREKEQKR
ncbi:MAG: rRNA maturation RNase YbeY [Brevinematia bacterium]